MCFDWKDFLRLAEHLAGVPSASSSYSQEAAKRTAVSRAYYAALCYALERYSQTGDFQRTHSPQDHKLLRDYLQRKFGTEKADELNELRVLRNCCDYEGVVNNLEDTVSQALELAKQIIDNGV
jgi:hypothetical protein